MENIKRIRLLSDDEINELYSLPDFNMQERELYFTLTCNELKLVDSSSDNTTWFYFVLQFGYFKAKQNFFTFSLDDVKKDVEYVLKTYNIEILLDEKTKISRTTLAKQRNQIAQHFGYTLWTTDHKKYILEHLLKILKAYPKKQNALRQLLEHFESLNLTIPSYRVLQDIFTEAYKAEEARWAKLIDNTPSDVIGKLDDMLSKNNKSLLNILKTEQKDFQFTAVREEVEKLSHMQEIYDYSKHFIPLSGLSFNASAYLEEKRL